ncbi:uncharacterized protein LOC135149286 isoform X3 [Daucus carota subsp. sativus]|uniref:uncharacterized protein LOC135149286 isoform X3 n=1 Tax=Daucus carota subsp. sativus TaxID=79200 RepID=UPI003083445F
MLYLMMRDSGICYVYRMPAIPNNSGERIIMCRHLEYQNTRRSHLLGFNTTGLHTHLVNRCAETLPHATPWISRKRVSESTDLDLQGGKFFGYNRPPCKSNISCNFKFWIEKQCSLVVKQLRYINGILSLK